MTLCVIPDGEAAMSRDRYKIFEDRHPHFLTSTVVNWLPIFGNPPVAQIVLDSLQFLQRHNRLTIYAYVILENHLHLVASADNLRKEIANFRSYTARQIIDCYKAQNAQYILKQWMSQVIGAIRALGIMRDRWVCLKYRRSGEGGNAERS